MSTNEGRLESFVPDVGEELANRMLIHVEPPCGVRRDEEIPAVPAARELLLFRCHSRRCESPDSREGAPRPDVVRQPLLNVHAAQAMLLLTRSVEKLTALGEVSQAVSSSLDLEMVLDTITERAQQLAGADGGAIYEYDEVSQQFSLQATRNVDATLIQALRATRLRKGEGVMGRAMETREPIQIADIAAPGVYESHLRDVLMGVGYRALLSVPIVREGRTIGSLSLNRKAPGEFLPEVIDVLKTFASQSALAIQNARLFREIADKSRQLEVASQHKSEFLANMSHELRTPPTRSSASQKF